jgi:hypothetical protein
MQYKTIVLGLLEQRPQLHSLLRKQRMLLPAMEAYALELKDRHEAWKDRLSQANPGSGPSQVASEALEIALKDLEVSLPPEFPQNEDGTFSLDAAMAFIRHRMPPG